jgi:Uma2 family endonuclease
MSIGPRRHRITVDEYYRMAEHGLFAPEARVELIEGVIIDMAPIGPPHMSVVDILTEQLVLALAGRVIVRNQGAIRLGDLSMPEPDLVLLRRRDDYYKRSFATPADIFLVIEVSDTSLRYDRHRKVPLYARHGIREVWVIDVNARQAHFFRSLQETGYADVSTVKNPSVMPIAALPGATVDLGFLAKL